MIRHGTRFLSCIPALVVAAALAAVATTARGGEDDDLTPAERAAACIVEATARLRIAQDADTPFADRMQACVDAAEPALRGMRASCEDLKLQCADFQARIDAMKARCRTFRTLDDECRKVATSNDAETQRDVLDRIQAALVRGDGSETAVPNGNTSFRANLALLSKAAEVWKGLHSEVRRQGRQSDLRTAWDEFDNHASRHFDDKPPNGYLYESGLLSNEHGDLSEERFNVLSAEFTRLRDEAERLKDSLQGYQILLAEKLRKPDPGVMVVTNLPPEKIELELYFLVDRGATHSDGTPYEDVRNTYSPKEPARLDDPVLPFHRFAGWRNMEDDTVILPSLSKGVLAETVAKSGTSFTSVFEEIPARVVCFDASGNREEQNGILRSSRPALRNPDDVFRAEPDRLKVWGKAFAGWQMATNGLPDHPEWVDLSGWQTMPVLAEATWFRPRYVPAEFPVEFTGAETRRLKLADSLPDVPVPAREHYLGLGWSKTAGTTEPDFAKDAPPSLGDLIHKPDAGLVLHPVYRPVEYTVAFRSRTADDASDAAWATNLSATVETRFASVPVPEPNLEPQYRFRGWFAEGAAAPAVFDAGTRITGNVTLTARFEPIEYTATFEGVGTFRFSVQKPLAKPAEVPAEPEGMTFDGWSLSGTSAPFTFTQESSLGLLGNDVSFAPLWKKREYDVRFTVGRRPVETFRVPHGERLRDLPDEPHHRALRFEGWALSMPVTQDDFYDFSLPVTNDMDLLAVFTSDPVVGASPPEPSENGVNNRLDSLVQWLSVHGVTTKVAWIADGALLLLLLFLLLLLRRR